MRLDEIIKRNPDKLPSSVPSQQHIYHGTELPYLAGIIRSDRIYQGGHWGKPGEPHGVRCTRSIEAAKSFAFDREWPGGIVVLNWPKLAQMHKTIPYNDTRYNDKDRTQPGEDWGYDEAEEVVLVRELRLSMFMDGVLMRPEELRLLRDGEYLKKDWLEGFGAYDGSPPYVVRRNIQALMDYKNLKTIQ